MKSDILKYTAEEEDEGSSIGSILRNRLNLSGRIVTGLKKRDNIFLNGRPAFSNVKVKSGDIVSVDIGREEKQDIEPEDIPIDIIFEDKDLLIVNKQPGLIVHPTKGHPCGTLSNGVIFHWRKAGEDSIVRLVNRLDRDTSGLLIIAKNQFSHQAMAKQMDQNKIEKRYFSIVHGIPERDEGTIDLPIDRPARESIKRAVMDSGVRAVTHYRVICRYRNSSLLEIILETGKTHQIRVHLSHIGHPLFGDTLYGNCDDSLYIKRQALHAYSLKFNHPRTGESMSIESKLPVDMASLVRILESEQ
jgi:23S rRNA pseudouridine1911/1915/1917 synthase